MLQVKTDASGGSPGCCHAILQNQHPALNWLTMPCRHLEDALHRVENTTTRNHDKSEGRIDKVLDEMESVRACAVSNFADTLQ